MTKLLAKLLTGSCAIAYYILLFCKKPVLLLCDRNIHPFSKKKISCTGFTIYKCKVCRKYSTVKQ